MRNPCLLLRAAGAAGLALLGSACSTRTPAPADAHLAPLVEKLRSEVNDEEAMRFMREVWASDRLFTFPAFRKTAEYVAGTLKKVGAADVELLSAPADGVTQYGFWTMPLAWDVKQAKLEIVDPEVPAEERVLADYPRIPTSLGMWSGPTPAGGITAEVVEMTSDSWASVEKLDFKGKLVLTRPNLLGNTYSLKWILIKKGALGAINAFTENPSLRDGRQWVNFWGDSGWAYTAKSTPLLWFSVTPRQADLLHGILASGGRVRAHATVESRYYKGTYPYATGVIRGTDPAEEVLELGHTSEYGANDNATGVAAMLEAVAALNRLISSGRLARPKRSIRILAMGEMYPTMHYLARHAERSRHTLAALCIDTPAGSYGLPGTEYTFRLNPDVSRSFTDALMLGVADAYFSRTTPPRRYHAGPYGTGSDAFLPDPAIGIPTISPTGGSGIRVHHNSEDTPEKVDARSLKDLTVVSAAFLYSTASAGEAEVPWLTGTALTRASQKLVEESGRALDGLSAAGDAAALAQRLRRALDRNRYLLEREMEGIASVRKVVGEDRRPAAEASIAPALERLRRVAGEQAERLRAAANSRAAKLGVPGAIAPAEAPPGAQMAAASRMVVTRKRMGTLPLDDLPVEQWEGYPYSSWALVPVTALYWCDGRRSLAEVIRLTGMEHDTAGFDFTGYFRFLARHGYVELVEK